MSIESDSTAIATVDETSNHLDKESVSSPPPLPNIVIGSTEGYGSGMGAGSMPTKKVKVPIYAEDVIIEEKPGKLLYDIPDSMKVGTHSEVFVRISASRESISIRDNISGEVQTADIRVTESMEVELIDINSSFKIVQNNKARQLVENNDSYTEWRWDITPIKSGNCPLKLVVSIIKNDETKQTVYVDTVMVKSNILYSSESWFSKYWQWLCSTIIIPFIIWLWKRRKKEKE